MALTIVQATPKANAGGALSVACTFTMPPVVGHGIVVCANQWRNTGQPLPGSCVDTAGNAYVRVIAQSSPIQATTTLFYCAAITATGPSLTVTVANTQSGDWSAQALEGSDALVVDQVVGAAGSQPTQPNTGATAALTGTDVLQTACHAATSTQTAITVVTATPPWVQQFEELPSSFISGEADTRSVSSAAGTTPSCSWVETAGQWAAVLVVFKAAAAAAVETARPYVVLPL